MHRVEVLLAGLGGQGVQLAGDVLARACTLAGKQVSVLPSYGAEARGTLIRAEVVVSDEEIIYPGVLEPELFVAFCQQAYDRFVATVSSHAVVLYDPASVTPTTTEGSGARQYAIPALEAATAAGNAKAANMVMLGALAVSSELISMETLREVLSEGPKKRAETSLKAVEKGFARASQQMGA
jgi:2-oxoacid:acceptor oxidoreductase gamma subunit (pyruvate/2-ketoisovalerate family)